MSSMDVYINNKKYRIKVVTDEDADIRTESDKEMDRRAKAAVESAINRAKVCKKPIARYDMERKQAYIELPDGGGRRYIEK